MTFDVPWYLQIQLSGSWVYNVTYAGASRGAIHIIKGFCSGVFIFLCPCIYIELNLYFIEKVEAILYVLSTTNTGFVVVIFIYNF